MTDQAIDPKYLEIFPSWLRSLGEDAGALGELVKGNAPDDVKRHAVAGLNYLFKSLDLIPDGMDDLGFLDDAFILRVAAEHAAREDQLEREPACSIRLEQWVIVRHERQLVDQSGPGSHAQGQTGRREPDAGEDGRGCHGVFSSA